MSIVSNAVTVTVVANSGPVWAQSLSLNVWATLSDTNSFNSVKAANVGQGNADGLFNAWNGTGLLTSYGTFGSILHWGGGHTDYYGNEVYRYDLASLTWTKLNNPSSSGGFTANQTDGLRPDGTPNAAHTYYYINARPSVNELVITKRQVSDTGPVNVLKVSRFNTNTLAWTNSGASSGVSQNAWDGACYDSSRDFLWAVSSTPCEWGSYNFATGVWTAYTAPTGNDNPSCGPVYCVSKDAVLGFNENRIAGLDPTNPNASITITTTGSGPVLSTHGGMPRWSVNLNAVVFYPNASNQIYLLTPPAGDWRTQAWTWTQRSVTGSSGPHTAAATLGKFQLVEWGALTVAIVVDDTVSAHRAVRLS